MNGGSTGRSSSKTSKKTGATSGAGTNSAAPRRRWSGSRRTPAATSASSTTARTSMATTRRRSLRKGPPGRGSVRPFITSWALSTSARRFPRIDVKEIDVVWLRGAAGESLWRLAANEPVGSLLAIILINWCQIKQMYT